MYANEGSAMTGTIQRVLELPFPPAILNPNKKSHWRPKAATAKIYRQQCAMLASQFAPLTKFTIQFFPPDNRKRDRDNIIAAFKAGQDGIADAWKINDREFEITYAPLGSPLKHGKVIVTLSQNDKQSTKGEVP